MDEFVRAQSLSAGEHLIRVQRATPGTATPGTGFVFMMQLKTKVPATKWTMAGVAMLLAID